MTAPLVIWIAQTIAGHSATFNDFHDYWLAGRLILDGRSPYDIEALRALARQEGLSFVVGTGYSYPLPFAVLMIPFALLSFDTAVLLFNGLSLAIFGLTVAWWIWLAHPADLPLRRTAACAFLAGAYPPVYGTIANGQANLVVLAPFALGVLAVLRWPAKGQVAGGIAIGLAAVVKLVPAVVCIPLAMAARLRAVSGLVAGLIASLALAVAAAPYAWVGSSGLADLLGPDSYFTNQSINGFLSRLVRDSDRTRAVWPDAFDLRLAGLVTVAALALLTTAVLWRARRSLGANRGLALAMSLAIVAATIGAPKNSFWNEALVLPALGLLIAMDAPELRFERFDLTDRLLLAGFVAGAIVQTYLWQAEPGRDGSMAAPITMAYSAALYGLIALWVLIARKLWRLRT